MPPKHRPRPYTTLDRDYLAQDTIRELGGRFGSSGPLVFLALILNAGKAISEQAADDLGVVDLRWVTLAREAFTSAEDARAIVAAGVELELLDEFRDGIAGGRFSARLTKAERWESRARTGAQRQATYRERRAGRDDDPSQVTK